MIAYREIDDLPGDLVDPEYALAALRSQHCAVPFDDVFVNGAECILTKNGELGGVVALELFYLLGARA